MKRKKSKSYFGFLPDISIIGLLGLLFPACITACMMDTTPPGDILFGEYLIEAQLENDGCDITDNSDPDFNFRARIAADLDGETAWIALANPPTAPFSASRRGLVEEDLLFFVAQQAFPHDCTCGVLATETIKLSFIVRDPNDDNETEPNTNNETDTPANEVPPIPNLPAPGTITGIEGTMEYELVATEDCDLSDEACTLPCSFDYSLLGNRQN